MGFGSLACCYAVVTRSKWPIAITNPEVAERARSVAAVTSSAPVRKTGAPAPAAAKQWPQGVFNVVDRMRLSYWLGELVLGDAQWQPHVVVDGLLITGQNPASSKPAAKALLGKLRAA